MLQAGEQYLQWPSKYELDKKNKPCGWNLFTNSEDAVGKRWERDRQTPGHGETLSNKKTSFNDYIIEKQTLPTNGLTAAFQERDNDDLDYVSNEDG